MHASGKAELDSGEKQVANDLLELTELFVDELARGTMHLFSIKDVNFSWDFFDYRGHYSACLVASYLSSRHLTRDLSICYGVYGGRREERRMWLVRGAGDKHMDGRELSVKQLKTAKA